MPEYLDPVLGVAYIISDTTALRYVTGATYHDRVLVVVQHPYPQKLYVFDADSVASDDNSTVLKPHDINPADPGRWLLEGVGGGGGAALTFLLLADTPGTYAGAGGSFVRVKSTLDGLEFADSASCVECPYQDNPDNWAGRQIPDTVVEAIQSVVRIFSNHLETTITSTSVGGEGCPYTDDTRYWTGGVVPSTAVDALRDIAVTLAFHLGFPIPSVGVSSGCVSFSDNPANWAGGTVPTTVLEATQCIVDALKDHLSFQLFDFTRFSLAECGYEEPNLANWIDNNPPPTVEKVLHSGIAALTDHLGFPLTLTVSGYAGCPYDDISGGLDWDTPPETILDALMSFIDNLHTHIGSELLRVGSDQGCVPFTDDPDHWGGQVPFTVLEATQSAIKYLVDHLAYQVRRLPYSCEEKECTYVDDASVWENGEPPRTIAQVLDMLVMEYFLHTGTVINIPAVYTGGCPYQPNPIYFGFFAPSTIPDALAVVARAFYLHLGAQMAKSGRDGCAIWNDNPFQWAGDIAPLTQLEAATSLALAWSTHLSRPLVNTDVETFLRLTDTPISYATHADKMVTVNPGETGLEFTTISDFGLNLAPTYVVASEDATPADGVRDCTVPAYLHKNGGVNDGLANALADIEAHNNGGELYIRRGVYETLANEAMTVGVQIRGEGLADTEIVLIDDAPSTAHWFLDFQAGVSQVKDLSIVASALTGPRPDCLVSVSQGKTIFENVGMGVVDPAGVGLGVLANYSTTELRGCIVYGHGAGDYGTGIYVEDAVLLMNNTRVTADALAHGVHFVGDVSRSILTENVVMHLSPAGHALYFNPGDLTSLSGIKIRNNQLGDPIFGGGVYGNIYVEGAPSAATFFGTGLIKDNEIYYGENPGICIYPSNYGVVVESNISGNTLVASAGVASNTVGILVGPAGVVGVNTGCIQSKISDNIVHLGTTTNGIGIVVGGYVSSGNRLDRNEVYGNAANQTGILLFRNGEITGSSGFPTTVNNNTIQIGTGATSASLGLFQAGICCMISNNITLNGNGIDIGDDENGRGIAVLGESVNTGFTIGSNTIRHTGSVTTGTMIGILVDSTLLTFPNVVSIGNNTILSVDNAYGIYANNANIGGTCVGNTVAGTALPDAFVLGLGLDAANNKHI